MTIHDPQSGQASPVGAAPSAELGTGLLAKILRQQAGSHGEKAAKWESPLFWKALAKGAGLLGASIGALVLLGWMLNIPALKSIAPDWVAMKANTALCFVLLGLALWLKASDAILPKSLGRAIQQLLSGIVVLLGLLTLLEYLANIDLSIDQWLFLEAADAIGTLPLGRMAPASALCFILLGSALLLNDKSARNRSLSATLAVTTAFIALISGLIYLYDINATHGLEYSVQLAANTVLAFSLLAAGLLCAYPEHGVVALLRRRDSGGAITRRLLPVTLFLPILLGGLKLSADHYELFQPDFGVALVALSYIVILTALVLWSARFLSRVYSERERMNAIIASDDIQLRTLLNTIPDLIWLKDINGVYLTCNPAFERFFGAKEAEITGKTDYDFVPRELADFFRANDQAAIAAENPSTNEEWLTIADSGQRILAETTKMPMFDQQGKLLGVLGIARDITAHHLAVEQLRQAKIETDHLLAESNQSKWALLSVLEDNKATTRALRLSQEHYTFLFNAIADAVYVHEILESGAPSHFLEVNEVACLLSGYTREELLGMTPLQLDAPDSGVDLAPVIQRLMAGESATFEQIHLHKNGQRIPVEIHSHLFKLNERPAVISIVRDITERKQAELNILQMNKYLEQRVLDRTAQLAASNKELEAFSYSVSHDLRAPLRSIAGFAELLRKQGYESIDDKGRHYMDVISESAVQMGRLIDDILTFSRIGRVEMTLSQVNLNQLLTEVQNTLRPQTEGRQIEWNIAPLPEVNGERTLLSLVLLNLLSNALKFTQTRDVAKIEIGTLAGNPPSPQSPDGTTSQSTKPASGQVAGYPASGRRSKRESQLLTPETVCYVKDNGVGFDMRHADKLFGLFQRLHAQNEFEGTGVGLANVLRIIQRHGGRVWAEGKVNAGATFYFALPTKRG